MTEEKKKTTIKEDIFDWIESMAISIFVVVIIFTFIFRIVQVSGSSMVPTLQNEDRIITTNLFYQPTAGDVIVCNSVGLKKTIVKRIIGVAGDTIDINFDEGKVYRNGVELKEDYIKELTKRPDYELPVQFPITVPEGTVFVMGDNRNNSRDSRSEVVGCIDTKQITGKVIMRIFPFNSLGTIKSANLDEQAN